MNMNFPTFKENDVLVLVDGILSSRDECDLNFLCSERNLPSLAPGGYSLQRLVDANDNIVVLTPLPGECESAVVCTCCCFRNQLKEVIKIYIP